jgi:hypothetical protein
VTEGRRESLPVSQKLASRPDITNKGTPASIRHRGHSKGGHSYIKYYVEECPPPSVEECPRPSDGVEGGTHPLRNWKQ